MRAAAPTRWPCASGPSSPIRSRWRMRAGRRRLRRRAHRRPQHAADRHPRTGRRVAGVVQRPSPLCLAGRAHAGDRRICVHVDAPRGSAPGLERYRRTGHGASRRSLRRGSAAVATIRRAHGRLPAAVLAASPLYLESRSVLALAGFVAHAAAVLLGAAGVNAHAAANVLWTPRGGFLVTQECISTPLIPVYLAAVCAYSATWRRLILGVLATVPLFVALGIAAPSRRRAAGCRGLAAVPRARVLSIAARRGGGVPRRALAPRPRCRAPLRARGRRRGAGCSSRCSVPSTRA